MQSHVESATIRRSVPEVWAVLADFDQIAGWAPNVDHSCLLYDVGDPAAVGTVRRIQAGRLTILETIVESDAGRCLAYTLAGVPGPARRIANRWTLHEAAGGTEVQLTTEVHVGPRPPQQVAERLAVRLLGRQSRRMLDGLAERLEGGRSVPDRPDVDPERAGRVEPDPGSGQEPGLRRPQLGPQGVSDG